VRLSEPDPARFISALFIGGLTGAALTSTTLIVIGAITALLSSELAGLGAGLGVGLMVAPFALIVWMGGILVVGAPFWALLHVLKIRSPQAGAILGAVLVFAVVAGLSTSFVPQDGRWPWFVAIWLAAIGAAVGWIMARVAYGKDAPR